MHAIIRALGFIKKALGNHCSFLGRERLIDVAEVCRVDLMILKSGKPSKRLMK